MFPLKDIDRRPSRFPLVTTLIIALNTLVFLLELLKGIDFVARWSYMPAEIAAGRGLIMLLTALFMHDGWLHIIGNMVFFWAFGPPVEDMMGRGKYLFFYLTCGVAASLAQVLSNPASTLFNLGASGAIAGVIGAFLVAFPRDRIRTLVFVAVFRIPAIFLVGAWFVIQLFSEVGSFVVGRAGEVAYVPHVAGFVFGIVFAGLFKYQDRDKETKKT
ncbi:MAG TPA: rhomboid family intramembrane serine protease [Nitrospirota bacterium]|nr:rhomboid family intramembrane serine protease [Nitrospirota bacterium]